MAKNDPEPIEADESQSNDVAKVLELERAGDALLRRIKNSGLSPSRQHIVIGYIWRIFTEAS